MRALWLGALLLVFSGCTVKVPRHPVVDVKVAVKAKVRVEAKVEAQPVEVQGAEVVEFFGIPLDDAEDVVFVLDRSGSMTGHTGGGLARYVTGGGSSRKIDVAHAELIDALQRLPAGTRVNVVYFNRAVDAYAPAMIALDDARRDELVVFVEQTSASGSTALAPAMRTALMMNPRRLVLLSDGIGNVGGGARAVLRDAREAMLGGVRIDTIGLGNDQDAGLLSALARESGGLYQAF